MLRHPVRPLALLVALLLAGCSAPSGTPAEGDDVAGAEVVVEVGGSARVHGVAGEGAPARLHLVNESRALDAATNSSLSVQLVEPEALLRIGLGSESGHPHFLLQTAEGCPMLVDDAGRSTNTTGVVGWTLTPERAYVDIEFQEPCTGTFSLRATFPSASGNVSPS